MAMTSYNVLPYLNHFKSDFDAVKIKVGLLFTLLITFSKTQYTKQIKGTKLVPRGKNQIYQTKTI